MLITIISQISITFDHLFHSKVEFALMRGQRLWVKKISLNKSQDMRSSSQKKRGPNHEEKTNHDGDK